MPKERVTLLWHSSSNKAMKSLIGFLLLVTPLSACIAQTADGAWTLGPNWAYNRNISNQEIARIAMQGEINKRLLTGGSTTAVKKKRVVSTSPGSYNTKAGHLMPGLISEKAEGTKEEKQKLKTALENTLKFYENIALQKQYPDNELEFALMYYVINNYVIYRNIDPAATDVSGKTQYLVGGFYSPLIREEQGLYKQLSRQIAAQKSIGEMSDEDKQKAAESLAIYTTLMWQQFQSFSAARDMDGLGNIRNQSAGNVESFVGAKIGKISIGNHGIVVTD